MGHFCSFGSFRVWACLPRSMSRPPPDRGSPMRARSLSRTIGTGMPAGSEPEHSREKGKKSKASPVAAGRPGAPAERGRGRAAVRQDGQGRGRSGAQPGAGTGGGRAPSSSWLGRAPLAGLGPGAPAARWNGPTRQTGVGQTVSPRPGRGLERPAGRQPCVAGPTGSDPVLCGLTARARPGRAPGASRAR